MIVLGIVLLLVGYIVGVPLVELLGIILIVVGVCLFALGSIGRPVGGRRFWY